MADENNEMYRTSTDKVAGIADAEAISRRDESLAALRRSRGMRIGVMSDEAEASFKAERESAAALNDAIAKGVVADLSGTPQPLSDIAGNYAPTVEVARAGGTGVEASNTDVASGQPATSAESAGTTDVEEVIPIMQENAGKLGDLGTSADLGTATEPAVVDNASVSAGASPTTSSTDETSKVDTAGATRSSDPRDNVQIPDGWEDLPWQQKRSIAASLSDEPINKGEDAARVIKAELARRKG